MHTRPFGKSGRQVSEIGMGCWGIGGNEFGNSYGTTDDAESIRAIRRAAELGCTFFDTADVYGHGHSERLLGIALKRVRDQVMIATKVGGAYLYSGAWGEINFSPEYIRFALEQSLQRLQTSYVDLYQLHNPTQKMIEEGSVFETLRQLQSEGKVRWVGVSVHTLEEGVAALDKVDAIQCVFNILNPKNFELMEAAKRKGVAVIIREPLVNGFAAGRIVPGRPFEDGDIRATMPPTYRENLHSLIDEVRDRFAGRPGTLAQVALRYVLTFDGVSTVIPGCKTVAQVEENLRAGEIPALTDRELAVFGS